MTLQFCYISLLVPTFYYPVDARIRRWGFIDCSYSKLMFSHLKGVSKKAHFADAWGFLALNLILVLCAHARLERCKKPSYQVGWCQRIHINNAWSFLYDRESGTRYCIDYWKRQLTLQFLHFQSELELEHHTNRIISMEQSIHGVMRRSRSWILKLLMSQGYHQAHEVIVAGWVNCYKSSACKIGFRIGTNEKKC